MGLFISKSKYLAGLQCPKLLWHYYNAKDKIPPVDEATMHLFNEGHMVGSLAKQLFPEGIEIAWLDSFGETIRKTKEALEKKKPLFEAGFEYKGCFTRADILLPVRCGMWDIVEVKSTTDIQNVNIYDLSFQKYVYENAGLKIRKCYLMHVNKKYVKRGSIDVKKLFKEKDVTSSVAEEFRNVEENICRMTEVIHQKNCPRKNIGHHCFSPYSCFLYEICSSLFNLTGKQQKQINAVRQNEEFVDKGEIKRFLNSIKYPVYYMDFETFSSAVPVFDCICPYQQVPFQFSIHLEETPGEELIHFSFLADGGVDPRPEFMKKLKEIIGSEGSIIVYNAPFEKGVLESCASILPEYKIWVKEIKERIVDLYTPFRSFHYYHPAQNGSTSLKYVLPAVTGKSYEEIKIKDGEAASRKYYTVTFTEDSNKRGEVRKYLEEYCALDTSGMADIIKKLKEKITGK